MTAALLNAQFGHERSRGWLLLAAAFAFSSCLILISFVRWMPLLLPMMVIFSGCQTTLLTTSNILLQSNAPPEMRGRMVGVWSLSLGLGPLGNLIAGWLASIVSIPVASAGLATLCAILLVGVLVGRPQLRVLQ
jgi:sugar phosphate permease